MRTDSVETDVDGDRTVVGQLAGKGRPALLLVNDEDLSYAKVRLDPHSEATVRSSLGAITDPMARALCWTALWDSARDAATPAARYVEAVQRFGPAESGIGVLLNILATQERQSNATYRRPGARRPAAASWPPPPQNSVRRHRLRPAAGLGPCPRRHDRFDAVSSASSGACWTAAP